MPISLYELTSPCIILKTGTEKLKTGAEETFSEAALLRKTSVLWQGEYYICTCVQLNEGGLGFEFPQEIPKNTQLVVTFQIPGGAYVAVKVRVEDINGSTDHFEITTEFVNLEFSLRRLIRGFVASRTS